MFELIIDTEDLDRVINYHYSWFVSKDYSTDGSYDYYYVRATEYLGKDENGKIKNRPIRLSRFLMNAKPEDIVDHEDHNGLNDRKGNLRISTDEENIKNRTTKNVNNTSTYRNVSWITSRNKWAVQLQINKKNKVLGWFPKDKLEEAGKFAEEMRQKYYGEFKGGD